MTKCINCGFDITLELVDRPYMLDGKYKMLKQKLFSCPCGVSDRVGGIIVE